MRPAWGSAMRGSYIIIIIIIIICKTYCVVMAILQCVVFLRIAQYFCAPDFFLTVHVLVLNLNVVRFEAKLYGTSTSTCRHLLNLDLVRYLVGSYYSVNLVRSDNILPVRATRVLRTYSY